MTKTSPAAVASALAKALEKHRGSLRIPQAFDLAVETLFVGILYDKRLCGDEDVVEIRERLDREAPDLTVGFTDKLGVAIVEHGLGADILGRVASELSTLDKSLGQFFTPPDLARLVVALSVDTEHLLSAYRERGIVTMHEPTIGSGAMAMAWAEAAIDVGVPRNCLFIEGWDIEATAARMAYIQLALLGIPARIVLGDVLSQDVRDIWQTPALIVRREEEQMRRVIAACIAAVEAPADEKSPEDGDDLAPAA